MFLVWFGLVCIPQISWRYGDGENIIDDPGRSELRCLRSCNGSSSCPVGTVTVYSCTASMNESVVINSCTDNNCESSSRPFEDSTKQTVCVSETVGSIRYCVFDNVDPEVGGFQWIIDFITGQVSAWFFMVQYNTLLDRATLIEQCCSMDSITMGQLTATTYHLLT